MLARSQDLRNGKYIIYNNNATLHDCLSIRDLEMLVMLLWYRNEIMRSRDNEMLVILPTSIL